jgi:hypothetical protein
VSEPIERIRRVLSFRFDLSKPARNLKSGGFPIMLAQHLAAVQAEGVAGLPIGA